MPTGLSLNAATGVITGTPTAVGTFNFTIQAADAFGDSNTQAYSIKVSYPAVAVSQATLPTGYVGSTYTTTTLAATGGTGMGYTWALATGSALPAGMNLSAAGVISGKPTAATPTSFTVTVTDSASNTANGTFSITVDAAVNITTATTLPTAYVASSYSQTLTATGGSGTGYTWALAGGSDLPAGLNLSAAGVLSGKPTTVGTPSFSVSVTDSVGNTAQATFGVTISAGVSINPATLPIGYPGTVYAPATLTATGGTGTGFTWTWAAATGSTLPAGLSISPAGVITGTPLNATTASIVSNVVAAVTDSVGNTGSANFSVTIEATLAISSGATLPGGVLATAYSDTLAATGGSGGNTWSTNPAGTNSLAAIGLSLSGGGIVSGASPTLGTAAFTATVTDSTSHTASLAFSVTVSNALTVTTTSLPAAYSGTAYSQTLAAAGGTGAGYTWTVTGTSNLATFNLTLSATGIVTGTPATSGTASFTAKVTDSASNTATQAFTFAVYNALALPAPNPNSLGAGTTGEAYTGTINASGGSGSYTWTVTGLPSEGLSSSSSGGTLTVNGTPTTAAAVSFGVSVTEHHNRRQRRSVHLYHPGQQSIPADSACAQSRFSALCNRRTKLQRVSQSDRRRIPLYLYRERHPRSHQRNRREPDQRLERYQHWRQHAVCCRNAYHDDYGLVYGLGHRQRQPNRRSKHLYHHRQQRRLASERHYQSQQQLQQLSVPAITVSINTSPVQTTTTNDSQGDFSFASIPNGTYTITPSITGPSSVFYPATYTGVVVDNGSVTGENFSATLGYTVYGKVSYSGAQTGQVYLNLSNTNCGGNGGRAPASPMPPSSRAGRILSAVLLLATTPCRLGWTPRALAQPTRTIPYP